MANIEIEVSLPRCSYNCDDFCEQCLSEWADGLECKRYESSSSKLPDGHYLLDDSCKNVAWDKKYVGAKTDSYEINERRDGQINVRIGRNYYYDCSKVTLNGKVIFCEEEENNDVAFD